MARLPLSDFAACVADAGYDGTEIYLPARRDSAQEIRRLHAAAGLGMVAHISTEGNTVEDHLRSLEAHYLKAVEIEPWCVNSHTGRDHFSFEDSLRIFEKGQILIEKHGVPVFHETHRGRALFSIPAARSFLRAIPGLQLTADFSHWVCVHESDLSDQPEGLDAAISAAHHIHARVGFDEGPQISDPRNPLHEPWLRLFTSWWKRIVRLRRDEDREFLTISPEFGPVPYMPLNGRSQVAVADAWEINLWMLSYLRRELDAE